MGSSTSKDSESAGENGQGIQEREQQTPAESRDRCLALSTLLDVRNLFSAATITQPPEHDPAGQAATTTTPAAATETCGAEVENTAAFPEANTTSPEITARSSALDSRVTPATDSSDNTATASALTDQLPSTKTDQSIPEQPVDSQESAMVKSGNKRKHKKKGKKGKVGKGSASVDDSLSSEHAPDQQTYTSNDTQSHAQLATIAEENEDRPAGEAAEQSEDNAVAPDDAVDGDKTPTQTHAQLPSRPAPSTQSTLPSNTGEVFRFDNFHPETRCRNPDCRNSTHPGDGSTKICPACGQRSKVRYCCKTCLYKDIRRHFLSECGQLEIDGEIDKTTLDDANKPARTYFRHGTAEMVNTVERHRQAVYFAMEAEGEYFIFDDMEECASSNPTKEEVQEVRGTGQCVHGVKIRDQKTRQMVRRSVLNALSWGTTNQHSIAHCEALAQAVILDLKAREEWDQQMCTYLCMQMGFEFQYQIPLSEQDWT